LNDGDMFNYNICRNSNDSDTSSIENTSLIQENDEMWPYYVYYSND